MQTASEVLQQIHRMADPGAMTKRQAAAFYEELLDGIEPALEALKYEIQEEDAAAEAANEEE